MKSKWFFSFVLGVGMIAGAGAAPVDQSDITLETAKGDLQKLLGDGFMGKTAFGPCHVRVSYGADTIRIEITDSVYGTTHYDIFPGVDRLVTRQIYPGTIRDVYYEAKLDGPFAMLNPLHIREFPTSRLVAYEMSGGARAGCSDQ